jgi:hypothetical protein
MNTFVSPFLVLLRYNNFLSGKKRSGIPSISPPEFPRRSRIIPLTSPRDLIAADI